MPKKKRRTDIEQALIDDMRAALAKLHSIVAAAHLVIEAEEILEGSLRRYDGKAKDV